MVHLASLNASANFWSHTNGSLLANWRSELVACERPGMNFPRYVAIPTKRRTSVTGCVQGISCITRILSASGHACNVPTSCVYSHTCTRRRYPSRNLVLWCIGSTSPTHTSPRDLPEQELTLDYSSVPGSLINQSTLTTCTHAAYYRQVTCSQSSRRYISPR